LLICIIHQRDEKVNGQKVVLIVRTAGLLCAAISRIASAPGLKKTAPPAFFKKIIKIGMKHTAK
jgi:hypothetical protein